MSENQHNEQIQQIPGLLAYYIEIKYKLENTSGKRKLLKQHSRSDKESSRT